MHIEIRKKCNIEENGYGGDKKVQYSVEGCSDSSKHTKKPHSYKYKKNKESKIQVSGAG